MDFLNTTYTQSTIILILSMLAVQAETLTSSHNNSCCTPPTYITIPMDFKAEALHYGCPSCRLTNIIKAPKGRNILKYQQINCLNHSNFKVFGIPVSYDDVSVGNETFLIMSRSSLPPVYRYFLKQKQHIALVKRQLSTRACLEVVDGQSLLPFCSQYIRSNQYYYVGSLLSS